MENLSPIIASFLPFALILGVFYFMLIRPQKKREQEVHQMRESLKIGDIIVTIGGIKGKILKVDEDSVIIETSNERTKMEFVKSAVAQVITATVEE
ncbi:MAG: preprotein translocase subunit YajC [Tissierellia bacterium]|nr:preprotein translocase subunit YajC [Tissierellia bacterium]